MDSVFENGIHTGAFVVGGEEIAVTAVGITNGVGNVIHAVH